MADWLPDATVTWIGYEPAVTVDGGWAVTLSVSVAPPSTVSVSACPLLEGCTETVHPSGPWPWSV